MRMAPEKGLIEDFIRHLKIDKACSPHTLTSYGRDLRQFEEQSKTPLSSRRDRDIQSYLAFLSKKGLEPSSIARKLSSLRQFYQYLIREEVIKEDPTLFVGSPSLKKRLPKALNEADIESLLKASQKGLPYRGESAEALQIRDRAMLYLLYATGVRVSELLSLPLQKTDTEAGLIRVMGKRSKERMIPFPPVVSELLIHYKEASRPLLKPSVDSLFVGLGGRRLTRQAFWKTLKQLAREAGIDDSLHPHMLRHTFATDLLKSGMNLRMLQSLLGHSDLQTTQIYTQVLPEKLREVVNRHHPRGRK